MKFLEQPDHFYFNILKPSIYQTRSIIKNLINADHVDEISIVDNATTAAAILFRHISWLFFTSRYPRGDVAIILHYAYGAVKKSLQAYVARAGAQVIEVKLPFPVNSNQEIISEFKKALDLGKLSGGKIRLAVIDHITSMPSVVIPVKELVQMCRDEGVDHIFVDGAHSIGCVDIDVKDIGADYYTSNLNKWLFCPPSVAFLYCKKSHNVKDLHHIVVSHEYGNGLPIESSWIGTRDYSAQLVVPEVMEFVKKFEGGIDGIKKRNHQKVVEMAIMLAKEWRTHLGTPPDMCSSMAMVGLPDSLQISSESDALKLRAHLRERFKVEVPIYFRGPIDEEEEEEEDDDQLNKLTGYARISHQVYNTVEDYHRFRDAINKLVDEGFTCSFLSD